ncbi:nicotinate-nucleotide--dimethylbenzimidazole phosphoribosyltransferase [Paenibacillus sp. 1001270B_150601_E10]|uniref:nicotinate-nucleotide--dimethylbenzimidazole phosphoribosyltransferase n=1 Tax=Paenibacillus sp. 1001270B_150601_E10 TaxID=2787079 RepID=UPI00189CAA26|nr:nicotinate-nucleotide--dimethylbenzimidazole phosphoribosyltransferase [Paenibacillus sp. 1001270B_150601_E10]
MTKQTWIPAIPAIHEDMKQAALDHQNQLTKPPGSLGVLEGLSLKLAAIAGEVKPFFERKAVVVMAADHGVVEEGVSAFPAEVTPQMVLNFLHGGAGVNVLARAASADVFCVDVGVNAELTHPKLISRKVKYGTNNMAKGPAMSQEEAIEAVQAGIDTVSELVKQGYSMFATGEMGIGNTTASAAILCAMTGITPEAAVGRGTGIGDEQWKHKCDVVRRSLEVNKPDPNDGLDVLAKIGGLEIAGLVGVILGAASHGAPVVIDGFISTAAALLAANLAPEVKDYLIGSHLSEEQGHQALLQQLGLTAPLHMNMRLGEGTGAALMFQLVDASCRIMREMATFAEAGVSGKEEA